MRTVKQKITKSEYDRYLSDEPSFIKETENNIPMSWSCGYGWYGCYCREEDGEYFIYHKLGESCD